MSNFIISQGPWISFLPYTNQIRANRPRVDPHIQIWVCRFSTGTLGLPSDVFARLLCMELLMREGCCLFRICRLVLVYYSMYLCNHGIRVRQPDLFLSISQLSTIYSVQVGRFSCLLYKWVNIPVLSSLYRVLIQSRRNPSTCTSTILQSHRGNYAKPVPERVSHMDPPRSTGTGIASRYRQVPVPVPLYKSGGYHNGR